MADQRIVDILNEAIALELSATIQYMWQHVTLVGVANAEFMDIIKKTSIVEMKHAERFADRLDYFGGTPTTKPAEIKLTKDITQALKDDIDAENRGITLYKKAIKLCTDLGDSGTRHIFEDILVQEEDHDHTFKTFLGQ